MCENDIIKLRKENPNGFSFIIKQDLEAIQLLDSKYPNIKGKIAEQVACLVLGYKETPKCIVCGNKPRFENGKYHKFCSCSCAGKYNTQKNKQTKLERYGNPNYNNTAKNKKTCLERYGRDNVFKGEEGKALVVEGSMKKYGVSNPHKTIAVINKTKNTNLLKYGKTTPKNFHARNISKGETEVFEYISSIINQEVVHSDRKTLEHFELDIYIPSLKLGVEYDGDYWHSLPKMVERDKRKNQECYQKGIKLIRIKESDWLKNQEEIKMKLKEILCSTITN